MVRIPNALDLVVDATAESFLRTPANYSDERALAEDVRSRLNAVLSPAAVDRVTVEESSGATGNVPDHEAHTARNPETTEIETGGGERAQHHRERAIDGFERLGDGERVRDIRARLSE